MARIENDNASNQSFHYIGIADGKFRELTTADNPKAVKRTDKNGNDKFELVFSALEGYITNIEFKVSPIEAYGESCQITIEDKDEKNLLQMQIDSGMYRSFAKRLPNLDPKLCTKLSVFKSKGDDGNEYANIAVRQDGKTISDFFKEDENLPKGEPVKGKKFLNFFDQNEYLKIKAVDVYMNKKGDFAPIFEVVPPAANNIPALNESHEYLLPKEPAASFGALVTNPEDELPF